MKTSKMANEQLPFAYASIDTLVSMLSIINNNFCKDDCFHREEKQEISSEEYTEYEVKNFNSMLMQREKVSCAIKKIQEAQSKKGQVLRLTLEEHTEAKINTDTEYYKENHPEIPLENESDRPTISDLNYKSTEDDFKNETSLFSAWLTNKHGETKIILIDKIKCPILRLFVEIKELFHSLLFTLVHLDGKDKMNPSVYRGLNIYYPIDFQNLSGTKEKINAALEVESIKTVGVSCIRDLRRTHCITFTRNSHSSSSHADNELQFTKSHLSIEHVCNISAALFCLDGVVRDFDFKNLIDMKNTFVNDNLNSTGAPLLDMDKFAEFLKEKAVEICNAYGIPYMHALPMVKYPELYFPIFCPYAIGGK